MDQVLGTICGALVGAFLGWWILKKFFKINIFPAAAVPQQSGSGMINKPFEVPGFQGRPFTVINGFWRPSVHVDGSRVKFAKGKGVVRDNAGRDCEIKFQSTVPIIDPVQSISIGEHCVVLQNPLKWYEYTWAGWTVLMLFIGGAIGAISGFAALFINLKIFRSPMNQVVKYIVSFFVSAAAVILWILLSVMIHAAVGA